MGVEPISSRWKREALTAKTKDANGAVKGNRTLVFGLADRSSTIELLPHVGSVGRN